MGEEPHRVTFLLVSGFMMAAYVLALDALRLANWRDGRRLFVWDIRTPDGSPAEASNGMVVTPDLPLDADPLPDAVFVGAGFSPEQGCTKEVFKWLRRLERRRALLCGWDTGPLILAEAGLMDGYRMALHWQALPAVQERYPNIEIVSDRCQIDRRRITGPGGVSTFDLVVAFIEQRAGSNVAQMVTRSANRNIPAIAESDEFTYSFRSPRSPLLARVVSAMDKESEKPPHIPEFATRFGISERALYRLFRDQLGVSPHYFYSNLRLQRAYDLLRQSDMPIAEIAVATGFSSLSRFSQAFKTRFQETPSSARKRPRWMQVGKSSPDGLRLVRTDVDSC